MRVVEKIRAALGRARAFLRNTDANVAMIFAISIIPVTIAAGAGLDLTRAMIVKSNLSEALDAAALSVGGQTTMTTAQMQTQAQNYFNANYKADANYGTPAAVAVSVSGQSITVTSSVPMPTTLMGVAGIHTVTISSSSTVVWGQTKLWVSLVLDNTGSMCQTDTNPNASSPCTNPPSNSKIAALKSATHQLLTMLQSASANAGDVQVAIVPFSKTVNVGTSLAGSTWIDWSDWESAPSTPSTSIGPGSSCPWSTGTQGYRCTTGAANGSSTTSTIPSSGLICPSVRSASASTGMGGHYFNGCFSSLPSQTSTTTTTVTTTTTTKQTCTQVGSGTTSCPNQSGYPKTASPVTNTGSAVVTAGYTGDSTTVTNPNNSNTVDGSKSCSGRTTQTCTWTRTITANAVTSTAVATGVGPYNHIWTANDHTTWTGCLMDRNQDYDADATTPTNATTDFPAENTDYCVTSAMGGLGYDWTSLSNQVDAMQPNGSTNQTIGFVWGWQSMTSSDPMNAPALPANTSRFIILVSDGLNTQDRFAGDGSNQSTTVDNRMALACTNAKAAGIVVYTIFIDLNGTQGNSTVLQNCASDSSKYFDLTTTGAIITTLSAIGQQITNLRVSQ
ncbi:MAG TPA: TadE/TadG family type IV pilus assembly protein [Rhizomicrobium sp.]|jgi:Flp pilus assembly protein TadG|nr:TadE/TadG family type IV pilus assembly protein [Rhizomicrobium sp.]